MFNHAVKGLEVLATYAGEHTPVPRKSFEDILEVFILIIISRYEDSFLWKLSLKSLVLIGSCIARFKDSNMQMIYNEIVVRRLVRLLHKDSILPLDLILEAISEIGTCTLDLISPVIQGLEEAMLSSFLQACVRPFITCSLYQVCTYLTTYTVDINCLIKEFMVVPRSG